MYKIDEILKKTIDMGASDIHIETGYYLTMRIDVKLEIVDDKLMSSDDTFDIVKQILDDRHMQMLEDRGDTDLSMSLQGAGRFRINVFKQRGSYSIVIR